MNESRRQFLKKSGCALGMATLASQTGAFGMMDALARTVATCNPPTDYKALVLVFLAGGNDGNNTVVPIHDGNVNDPVSPYQAYSAARQSFGLAFLQGDLLPITPPRIGLDYGLHPSLGGTGGIYPLWEKGDLAIVTNVGTLVQPTTKAQYALPSHPKPFQLFSHSDQIEQQQSAFANGTDYKGWGGRISNRMALDQVQTLPMLTSVAGSQLFITGGQKPALVVADANTPLDDLFALGHDDGGIVYQSISPAFNSLVTPSPSPSPAPARFVRAANDITRTAITAHPHLDDLEVNNPGSFPLTGIGKQLQQVARLIKLSDQPSLNIKRQIFFCQLGGFDTHAYQMSSQAALLSQFSQAVRAFYEEMESQGKGNKVTTFTMSDFSRTLNPNGTGASAGTDHAWGNHMFVIGGSVVAADFYGINTPNGTPYPMLKMGTNGPDDADSEPNGGGRGRWIPTTSVEEYALTLARWFGLCEDHVQYVFPNYPNFNMLPRCGHMDFLGAQPC